MPTEKNYKDNENVSAEILRLFQDDSINNYSSQIKEGLLEKLKPSELVDILDSLSGERLTVFLISLADTIIPPEENIYNEFNIRLHYVGHIEPYVPISLKDKITGIIEKSDLKSMDLLGEFFRDEWDLQLSIGIIDEKEYYLNKYYKILIEIMDNNDISEEEIQSQMQEFIEKGNKVITATNKLAKVYGIENEKINVDEIFSLRKQRKDLTDFKSIEELDKFIKSKVPRFIKGRYAHKGKIFKEYEDFEKAKECYEKALDIDSDDDSFIGDFYEVLMELREFEKAEFWLNKQLEQDHNWREDWALQEKAYHYLLKDNIPKVLETLKTLLEKGSRDINWILQDLRFSELVKTADFRKIIAPIKVFKVNNYIELKFEIGGTALYVGGELLRTCSHLTLINPYDKEYFNNLEDCPDGYEGLKEEEEFWGLCSCLQGWAENMYNAELLHGSLVLALLDRLMELGDPIAQQVYKKEILRMIKQGDYYIHEYLRRWNYISKLSEEELLSGALNSPDSEFMLELSKQTPRSYSIVENFDTDEYRKG